MKRWIGIVGGVAAVGLAGWLLSQKPAGVESGGVAPVAGPVAVVAESAFPDKGGAAVSAPAMDVAAAEVPPVSGAVQVLVDPASDYAARLAAMRQLGYAIAPQDVAALMDFLNAPLPEETKLKPSAYNSVRNDALELQLAQEGDTTMIRCAAIATLGDLGTADDMALLETHAASGDKRIRQIAQTTLAKCEQRTDGN